MTRVVIPHVWIPLSDGCRLSARVWLPEGAGHEPVPAILEYIPYRKGDATAVRDAGLHGWFADHGYAAVRVDLRGSGDSEGILEGEYLPLEQRDGLETLRWIAAQPWCTGRVGVIGKSWGGFNALQLAAHNPPELGAVISVASTDDRYADDVHYVGGCVLAWDMLSWACTMLAYTARPPDPEVVGEAWRARWLERLERSAPFVEDWLAHQRRDAFWAQGSVCEDRSAIRCPVYLVGGWADGYRNAVLRFLAEHPGPARAMIGPWGHVYPHDAAPGPAIGFLQEALRWWDRWLKGVENGIEDEPRLRVWLQDAVRPAPAYAERPGRWLAEPGWPSPNVSVRELALGPERTLGAETAASKAQLTACGRQAPGTEGGAWCGWGGPADRPTDQRADDALSLCFDSAPLAEPVAVLGRPVLRLEVASDEPLAIVAVRLCDVWPDGASTLVTRGLLNLAHRDGHDRPAPLQPGRRYAVDVPLDAIAYALPAGHRLRVALSPTYWPIAWPSPRPATLAVSCPASVLALPVREVVEEHVPPAHFTRPERAPAPEVEVLGPAGGRGRELRRDASTGAVEIVHDLAYFAPVRLASGLRYAESGSDRYTLVAGDPLSAATTSEREIEIARGAWSTRVRTASTMTATAETFSVTNALEAFEGARRVFARTWHATIPRDHV